MNRDILSKIEQEQMISREELEELLTTTDRELIEGQCSLSHKAVSINKTALIII